MVDCVGHEAVAEALANWGSAERVGGGLNLLNVKTLKRRPYLLNT